MAKKKDGFDLDWSKVASDLGAELLDEVESVKTYIDTGVLAINYVCSGRCVGGGIPSGKIIEIYGDSASGKSLIGANILKGTQTISGVPILLDAERSLNKEFAIKASKINPKKMLVLEADTLEQAFNKINSRIKKIREEWKVPSELPIVIIYDSIAASPSEREYAETELDMEAATAAEKKEAGVGSDKPGERAKICSKELRKLPAVLKQYNASVVFINQIREKIGIMYGCFSYHSKVMLSDGSFEKIGKIVNNRLQLEVMSLNMSTGKVEPKKIIGWHNNGNLSENESFMKIRFKRHFAHQDGSMMCTPNHDIIVKTDKGFEEIKAEALSVGDKICCIVPKRLNSDQWQVVYGSIMGDGSLRTREYGNHELRISHGIQQSDYCQWKQELLSNVIGSIDNSTEKWKRYGFTTTPLSELEIVADYKKGKGDDRTYRVPDVIVENMNELGLAIWYMDDGTYSGHSDYWGNGKCMFCCKKYPDKERLLPIFERFGLKPTIKDVGLVLNSDDTIKLHQLICRFVPDCMAYKLHPKYRYLGNYEMKLPKINTWEVTEHEVKEIDREYRVPFNSRRKFDLTIEDNSTYCVGGAFVHNSNETTAGGGRALEYYASLRMKVRANKVPKDNKGNILGVNISIQNTKNRCYKPFVEAKNMHLFFEQGINPFGGLLELLLQAGRIDGKGTYTVQEPWAGGKKVTFKASKERNDIPAEVLLQCPALVDATDASQVQYYIDLYKDAINAVDTKVADEQDSLSDIMEG